MENAKTRLIGYPPTVIKIAVVSIVWILTGCIEPEEDIVYGPGNPDPYPANWDVAVLDSIVPESAYPTDDVIIRGSGFDENAIYSSFVYFGIARAVVTEVREDRLDVEVPFPYPLDYFFADTVDVMVALQGSYDWSNTIPFIFKPMAHVYLPDVYPDPPHTEETFTKPRGLAVDPEGNLYLLNARTRAIYKDSPEGMRTVHAFGGRFEGGLRMGPDGYLYAAGNSNNIIYKIPPEGGNFEEWTTIPSPWGMDFDRFGSLFVVDNSNGHLYRVSPEGAAQKALELPGTGKKAYCRVYGDTVYVNEYSTGIFFKIPFTEDSVASVDTLGTTVEGFVNDITFGIDGTMYITGVMDNKSSLIKVDSFGDQETVVDLDGDLGFITWRGKFMYISSLDTPVYKVLIHDNEPSPFYGRGD